MLLGVDVGNTHTIFALMETPGRIRGRWRAETRRGRSADEWGAFLSASLGRENLNPGDIQAVIVASVVPVALDPICRMCADYLNISPLVAGEPGFAWGLDLKVDRPEAVGADRLVNARSALSRIGGNVVVVDFGTATTFDVVAAEGAYLGGVIAPGIAHSLEGLYRATALLPRISMEKPASVIGRDTVPALESGAYYGYVGIVEKILSRIREEWDRDFSVVATGGMASLIAEGTSEIGQVLPDLTLEGLYELYRLNSS